MPNDRETVVVGGGGGAGWFVAGIIVVALILFGFLFYNGYFDGGGNKLSVDVNLPTPSAPATPGGN